MIKPEFIKASAEGLMISVNVLSETFEMEKKDVVACLVGVQMSMLARYYSIPECCDLIEQTMIQIGWRKTH